ncbi:hypothetical protein DACRYDRAFT_49735 [Dacryopinax primogenitus]|uniref:Uncharacterized protein n=1 Tax=Dacryopinax primogenitus (strain DJM 731) TaxID=1858805 RepID=M5GEZ6_DACPD|nr:uncharacterized protein DACRYDRAFT_49735 [Dacryopinax primogenitus]EJU03693.1 hypothetical protein DACRYDRAFT_49735 [Dacryopinax primogenitus]
MLLSFYGQQYPQNDIEDGMDYYCGFSMMLLKPWRIPTNILPDGQLWMDAFGIFLSLAWPAVLRILGNFQFLHKSQRRSNEVMTHLGQMQQEQARKMI